MSSRSDGLSTDPADLKVALQAARREKARLGREGEPTEEVRARIEALEAALEAATMDAAIGPVEGGIAVRLHGDEVVGIVAVKLAPGISKDARAHAIDDVLTPHLTAVAEQATVVLAADAHKFTLERPGRDAEGRTVLDVRGRLEGDRIVPDVGTLRASSTRKRR